MTTGKKRRNARFRTSMVNNLPPAEIQKYKEFFNMMNQHKKQQLMSKIKNYHGKNVPISYKDQYQFTQQWESKQNSDNFSTGSLLETLGTAYICYQIFTMILCVAGIWIVTVQRYFDTRELSQYGPVYHILIAINVIDIITRICLKYRQTSNCPDLRQFAINYYKNVILISYFMVMLTYPLNGLLFSFGQLVIVYLLYNKASETYDYIRVMEFGLQYESYIKITDLLLNIVIQAHVFVLFQLAQAIIFFSASQLTPGRNWVTNAGIQNENYLVKYVNSIYFACTTMLTIGYGDISPQSIPEKIITIFIEIVGVIAFGYLLNQMGHTLSKMREKKEIIERDMQTISKISKYYNLDRKLTNKARNFIFNNQGNNQELKIQDEKKLLMKLNEDLRQEINLENSLNIVKSSIFYLCHWSKTMQSEIAQRLEKRIFTPNQKLVSSTGKDRIYIIKKGKIAISMNRYGSDQEHRRVLKIIDTSNKEHIPVTDNVYGYTAVFSNRPVKLQAVAKVFTSTYSVNKEDIEFAIRQNEKDYEYYHEIKCRIDQSNLCEEFEAPAIKNIRQHYCPSVILVLKKYRKMLDSEKNKRTSWMRASKHKQSLVGNYVNINRYLTEQIDEKEERTIIFERIERQINSLSQVEELSMQNTTMKSFDSIEQSQQLANLRLNLVTKDNQQSDKIKAISASFDVCKEYTNFFSKNNLSQVLFKLQKQNFMESKFSQQDDTFLKVQ